MPTWSGILQELKESLTEGGPPDFDGIRRKYLAAAHAHSARDTILYAVKFTQHDPTIPPDLVSITDEDIQGIMEVIHGLSGPNLDLILHSPGGSLEAAEGLVRYLRSKFEHIRVVVPQLAMSAATMVACAADRIVMGKHSSLGPTDPQIVVNTPLGRRMIPAAAIMEQFQWAIEECQDRKNLAAWLPMLNQYGPDLLVQCQNVSQLSEKLVANWLATYMFKGDPKNKSKARSIAKWLAKHSSHKTHGRHIDRDTLEQRGLTIDRLEHDQNAQEIFLSVFHATTHTFDATSAVKIIENHLGKAFIKTNMARIIKPQPQKHPGSGTS